MRKLALLFLLLPSLLLGATPKLPPEKELKALVTETLIAFNKGVLKKDFAQFHQERLSPDLRKEFPIEKFTETFKVFIDKNYDISSVAETEPVFEVPPSINDDGVLVLKGRYDTKPNKVTFTLKYVNESSAWKLIAINVKAVPFGATPAKVPSGQKLNKLVLDSLMEFNDAVQTGDFGTFYDEIAKAWQKETTPDELLKIFQSFVDQDVDIESIKKLEPTFDGKPSVNDDGHLVVKGSYLTPAKILFELKYLTEDDTWKLVGLNVRVEDEGKDKSPSDDEEDKDDSEDNE